VAVQRLASQQLESGKGLGAAHTLTPHAPDAGGQQLPLSEPSKKCEASSCLFGMIVSLTATASSREQRISRQLQWLLPLRFQLLCGRSRRASDQPAACWGRCSMLGACSAAYVPADTPRPLNLFSITQRKRTIEPRIAQSTGRTATLCADHQDS